MLTYTMGVSVDGLSLTGRAGSLGPSPSEEQFRFHVAQVRELGPTAKHMTVPALLKQRFPEGQLNPRMDLWMSD